MLTPVKKVAQKGLKQGKKELDQFFEGQQVPERCENCNLPLNAFGATAKRFVTAHILEKNERAFPEVATHPMNRMFLGSHLFSECSCHSDWDNSDADHRKQMRVYPLAIERVKQFIHLIPENKLPKLEKYLGL